MEKEKKNKLSIKIKVYIDLLDIEYEEAIKFFKKRLKKKDKKEIKQHMYLMEFTDEEILKPRFGRKYANRNL
jgi:succinate dehydrogenase flavin-adding protein (antitoxin of CptAB toxin-antitoxin module)